VTDGIHILFHFNIVLVTQRGVLYQEMFTFLCRSYRKSWATIFCKV